MISAPDKTLLENAQKQAFENWVWWEKDFLEPNFKNLPLLQNYPYFRGFGADYSVFRGLTGRQCEELRKKLLNFDVCQKVAGKGKNATDFNIAFDAYMNILRGLQIDPGKDPEKQKKILGQNRISLFSKLLCKWRPNEFAMWDSLARKGLPKVIGSKPSEYSKCEHYTKFNTDFWELYESWKPQLEPNAKQYMEDPNISAEELERRVTLFAPRILDSYLMLLSKEDSKVDA